MKSTFFLLSLALLLGVGCVQESVVSEPDETPAAETEARLTPEDVVAMTITEEDLDVNRSFELSKHTTYFASSADGVEWILREEPVAHYASVPELVVATDGLGPFPTGTLLVYFVDGTQDHGREDVELGLVYSTDGGETWSDRLYTTMEGMPDDMIAVDPSLVLLEDGRLRLYYFDFAAGAVPGGFVSEGDYKFHTATSENGIDFTYEGLVFSTNRLVTDPDVIQFKNTWRMYFMSHEDVSMMVSISDDPRDFSSKEKVNNNGIPGVIVMNGEVWLYSCGQGGITRLTSEDGVTFTEMDASAVFVENGVHCDPSVAQLNDGSYGMVLKHIRAQDLKQPQPR